MQLNLKTWNDININDGTVFQSWFPIGQLVNLSAAGITVPLASDFPFLSTSVLQDHNITLQVKIQPNQSIPTYREILKGIFNVTDRNRHNLVAEDVLDANRQWYLTGFPTRVVENKPGLYAVTIQLEMPVWRVVTALSDVWSITASGQTRSITNIGNVNVRPSYAIKPTVAKTGGWLYRRWLPVTNTMTRSFTGSYDVLDGNLDTATLISGGKMQSDGDDLRIWMNGVEVDRWLGRLNTTTTNAWVNLSLSPKQEGTTSVNISNVGAVTTISFSKTRANLAFLRAMKKAVNKVVVIDNEAFLFTDADLVAYQLTGCSRQAKNTSAATHTAPKTCKWIEHDIWVLYGNSAATAPDVDDTLKPIFNLSTSWNDYLIFANFVDDEGSRFGEWAGGVRASRSQLSYVFTANQNTFVNPSTELGMALIGYIDHSIPKGETGTVAWVFSHPCGITDIKYSGKKYRTGTWPAVAGLQKLEPNAAWFTVQNQAAPITPIAWEAFGPHTVSLGATYDQIRFALDGSINSIAGETAMMQFDTVEIQLKFDNVPVLVFMGAEQGITYLDFKLTNNTSGEYLLATTPITVNDTLTIDTNAKTSTLGDSSRVPVIISTDRETWLDLRSGSNQLQYDDTGTNAVTLTTTHRDRTM
ncbi:MAG: hypothetical protein L0287_09965 [Anaerolineae bacterium]|nr:hypothetical protein [Anaerolineae bacterium]